MLFREIESESCAIVNQYLYTAASIPGEEMTKVKPKKPQYSHMILRDNTDLILATANVSAPNGKTRNSKYCVTLSFKTTVV